MVAISCMRHTQEQGMLVFLKEGGVAGFHTAQWLDFMTQLRDKFGSTVQRSLYTNSFIYDGRELH